ncbi:hypothetical protein R50072_20300 [Simiduia litorea]|uniref:hypothetical protein n=1 Tax=Simiduia litorea TaxID=1435348 RepID=UPI0036F28BD7
MQTLSLPRPTFNRLFLVGVMLTLSSLSTFANQCLTIQCDCATLTSGVDKLACEKQQLSLEADCKATGNLTGYCQIAGLDASPLPFSLYDLPPQFETEKDVEKSLGLLESMYWSAQEDLKSADNYQNKAAYGNALTVYKNLSATLDRAYGISRQAYNAWRALDEKGEAEDVAEAGYEKLHDWADVLYISARGLWAKRAETDPKLQKKRLVLAMNVLRYAGNSFQQAAELASLTKDYPEAARAWQAAAETSVVMISWRQQAKSKAQYINYYRQQGVASWYRAALYWDKDEEPELAAEARLQAERLQQTAVVSAQ